LKSKGKKRMRIFGGVLAGLTLLVAAAVIFAVLLSHKPAGSAPPAQPQTGHISQYVSNELLPHIYNNAQLGKPFDVVIPEDKTGEIITSVWTWPRHSHGLTFLAPTVFFGPDLMTLMGRIVYQDSEFVVTVEGKPAVNEEGLLSLYVTKVKVGAVDLTLPARLLAKEMYDNWVAAKRERSGDIVARIMESLLYQKPFDFVFEVQGKAIKVGQVKLEDKKLTIRLVPVQR